MDIDEKEASQTVLSFLKSNVRISDIPNIESELKKEFVFAKTRNKTKKPPKKKARYLSRKQKKELGFYHIPRNGSNYSDFEQMNSLWTEYMSQLIDLNAIPNINDKNWDSTLQTIYKSDFHGSFLKVIRSKCPSYVGKSGICIMDTKNTFKIISKNNIITTILKKDSVFEMHLRDWKIIIFGKQLAVRPAERTTKKVKLQSLPDI